VASIVLPVRVMAGQFPAMESRVSFAAADQNATEPYR
jgi:hypothetical protein